MEVRFLKGKNNIITLKLSNKKNFNLIEELKFKGMAPAKENQFNTYFKFDKSIEKDILSLF